MRRHTSEPAPAKVNLALSVGPPDVTSGLHPINSWMVTVDFADELAVTRLDEGSISRYAIDWHEDAHRRADINWRLTDDLAVRAHHAMERYTGRQLPVQMRLRKRIPLGAGLGGGLSNAAAMLRALDCLFELRMGDDALRHIAASIGSDVAFLVRGGSALVSGYGERVEPVDLPAFSAVLVLPEAHCPTGAVYGRFDALGSGTLDSSAVNSAVAGGRLFNDLAPAAMDEAPVLRSLADEVASTSGRDVHVSGSGSTLFVVCDTPLEAGAIATAITERHGVPSVPVKPMSIDRGLVETID